jgi:hypothetical protein
MLYNICYSSSLKDELLIINGGLTWEGLVRCLVSFGVDGMGIFYGIQIGVIVQLEEKYASFLVGVHCMA